MGETTTGAAYRPAQEAPIGACFNNNSFTREEVATMAPERRELFACVRPPRPDRACLSQLREA